MHRDSLVRQLIETAYALAITIAVGKWAIHYAYLERGYESVGGEYLLILVAYWVAYKTIQILFDALEEEIHGRRHRKKRRSRRSVRIHDYR